ncbi:MAG: DUF6152 family protein [Terriglobia bacterium]
MKNKVVVALLMAAGLLALSSAVSAHHSAAGLFSPDVEKTLTGTVKQWLFVNPHPAIVMEVKTNQGVDTWRIQFPATAGLSRRFGWTRNSIKPGDEIKILGNPYLDDHKVMFPLIVTLPDGKGYTVREPRTAPE